jgi:hypothetical protein
MPEPTPAQLSGASDDSMRFWLAVIVCVGLFGFIGLAFFKPPQLPGDVTGVIIGYFAGWVSAIVGFYFGSSSGSKIKTMQANPDNQLTLTTPAAATTTVVQTGKPEETKAPE